MSKYFITDLSDNPFLWVNRKDWCIEAVDFDPDIYPQLDWQKSRNILSDIILLIKDENCQLNINATYKNTLPEDNASGSSTPIFWFKFKNKLWFLHTDKIPVRWVIGGGNQIYKYDLYYWYGINCEKSELPNKKMISGINNIIKEI